MADNKKKYDIEVVQEGFANGVAPGFPLNDKQKENAIGAKMRQICLTHTTQWVHFQKNMNY